MLAGRHSYPSLQERAPPLYLSVLPPAGLRAVTRTSGLPAAASARSDRVWAALEKSTRAAAPPIAGPQLPPARSADGVDPPGSRAPSCRRAEPWEGGKAGSRGGRRGECAPAGHAVCAVPGSALGHLQGGGR